MNAGEVGAAASRPLTTGRTFGQARSPSGHWAPGRASEPDSAGAVVVRSDLGPHLLNTDNEHKCVLFQSSCIDVTWMNGLHCKFLANNTLKAVSNSMRRDDKYFSVQ